MCKIARFFILLYTTLTYYLTLYQMLMSFIPLLLKDISNKSNYSIILLLQFILFFYNNFAIKFNVNQPLFSLKSLDFSVFEVYTEIICPNLE